MSAARPTSSIPRSAPGTLRAPVGSLRHYRGAHAAHEHSHAQVLLGLAGCLALEINGRLHQVDASCGLVLPAGARHGFHSAGGARVWVVDAPDGPGLDRLRAFALPPRWSPQADAGLLLQQLAAAPRVLQRRRLDPALLDAALAGRLHEAWPTTRLAALFHLSVPQFHARWLALTGQPPQAWLRARRLDAAQRCLGAGLALEATALQLGYRSASALGVALRRERGLGARQLRRG